MKLSDPKVVGSKARRYLRAAKPPFFLTLFFSTPHFPFASPHPYYKFFADPHYDGPFKYEKPILSGLRQGAKGDEDKRQVRALYDGAIRAVDDEIHKVLETLRDRDLEHNTIIVIMSDHGVSLYESGVGMSQGEHLRGPWTLAITFVLYHPKENFKTQKVDSFVSSLDVMPTLLDLLEIEKPDTLEGKSLIAFLSGSEDEDREVFAETGIWFYPIDTKFFERERIPYPDITKLGEIDLKHGCDIVIKEKYEDILNIARHRMVIYDGWKLIYMPTINGVKYELYNIKHDPYNEHNLIDQEKEVAHELKQRLFRWLKRDTRYKIKEGFLVPL
jgi:arylsulfatase A-like enzyme